MTSPRTPVKRQSNAESVFPEVPGGFPGQSPISPGTHQLSLAQAVHARRAEFVRPKTIRIKVGTWNTASFEGTEKDLGGWFVKGQGISPELSKLNLNDENNSATEIKDVEGREPVDYQEARYTEGQKTLPKNDVSLLPSDDEVGLYLLGLQEIVDVTSASEALRPYTNPEPAQRWKKAVEAVLPKGYILVAEQQLIGLLLLIYASPDVRPDVKSVSTTSVGTGLMGYMGNKGAVTARIVLGETTRMVFINSHLAAGAEATSLDRRNWDYGQIVSRTKFEPIRDSMDLWQAAGETIDDADIAFWAGDLNYRLADIPGDDVRRLLMLHTRDEYDVTQAARKKIDEEIAKDGGGSIASSDRPSFDDSHSTLTNNSTDSKDGTGTASDRSSQTTVEDRSDPSEDPASLQTTLASLLPHDELSQQIRSRKAFADGWKEGPITFLPTYKYDPGSVGVFDSSEKRRAPSWCDRILYRTRRDKLAFESTLAEEAEARKRDAELQKRGIDEAGKDEELLYDYDPDEDAADDEAGYDDTVDKPEGVVITKEGFEDEVHLEHYTAHQRVLSSDHKPLDAIFTLKYNYIVPELKAKIQQQVARELDSVENSLRPSVTVIVDKHSPDDPDVNDEDPLKFEGIDFGKIRYATRKHRSLTIANTGQVAASISFIDRPVGDGQKPGSSPVWLRVDIDPPEESGQSPRHFVGPRAIEPGETCNVDLTCRVRDRHLVRALNEGIKQLDDILVLRVENGRDHFIPVRGKWMETSLGRSIDRLIRIPEGGFRRLQSQKPKDKSNSAAEEMPVKWSAPRELFRLTDTCEKLTEMCTAEWEMKADDYEAPWVAHAGWPFAESSWTTTTAEDRQELSGAICDALDNNLPLDECLPEETTKLVALETLSGFLLEYLDSMPDGIIPEGLWLKLQEVQEKAEHEKKTMDLEARRTLAQEVMSESPPQSISFILVTSMLDRIINEQIASTLRTTSKNDFQVPPPLKRTGSIRKKEMSKEPKTAYRQIIIRQLSQIFGDAIIRTPEPEKAKEKVALADRKTRFVELFLTKEDDT